MLDSMDGGGTPLVYFISTEEALCSLCCRVFLASPKCMGLYYVGEDMKYKSIYKTITYRLGSTLITIGLLQFFLDSWAKIGLYIVLAHALKMTWYFFHEKLYRYIKRRFILK